MLLNKLVFKAKNTKSEAPNYHFYFFKNALTVLQQGLELFWKSKYLYGFEWFKSLPVFRFFRKSVIRPKVHFFAKIQETAQPRGFRAFWFKTLKYTCQVFFCNISLFGFIFAHFLLFSQKNKTSGEIYKTPKKRVVMRFAHKKRITFAWYTKVIP